MNKFSQLISKTLLSAVSVAAILGAAQAEAGTVYWTSLASSSAQFNELWKYDTDTNVWSQLNDFFSGSTFAVDQHGDMFAYSGDRTAILKYDSANDVWNHHMAAPTLGGTANLNQFNLFNLEVTNEGRFLLTGNGLTDLYYSDGSGVWNSHDLGFQTNATGDYDPTTGQYMITPFLGTSPHLIDTQTFADTTFTGTGGGSDWRRSGTILNGKYYSQTSTNDIEEWDIASTSGPNQIGNPSNSLNWAAMTANRDDNEIFMADGFSSGFYKWDAVNGYTQLSNTPINGNHTAIAYVGEALNNDIPDVPAPAAFALFGLGAFAMLRRK